VVYEATNYTQLFRHVVFQDADRRLTADEAHYFEQENRLRAWGQVVLTDLAEGSVIRGDTVLLLRSEIGRPEDQLTVWGMRPHATLYPTRQPVPEEPVPGEGPEPVELPPDTTGAPPPDTVLAAPPPQTRPPHTRTTPQEERKPYEIRSRRMFLEGSRYFRAAGGVTIDRDSVHAVADSVEYDADAGSLFLSQEAVLTTSAYELSGATIQLDIPQDEIRSVTAREDALLEGEDLWLLAPTISLLMEEGKVQRLVAVQAPAEGDSLTEDPPGRQPTPNRAEDRPGRRPDPDQVEDRPEGRPVPDRIKERGIEFFPTRPHAFAEDFLLWADSIEVLAPDEVLQEVWAMGLARGESLARDSLNTPDTPPLVRRDWLEGDTIIAIFVPNADTLDVQVEVDPGVEGIRPPPPSAEEGRSEADSAAYRLDRLIAKVQARSLYRLAPTDSTASEGEERLAIHYVTGGEITIFMNAGEVDRMEVAGATRGIHLEPVADRRRVVPPDTTGASARPDRGGKR